MKKFPVLLTAVLLITAGSVLAQGREAPESIVLELTEDQVSIIVHNCPRNETVAIQLTEEQISIIVHNYPQVEIAELDLSPDLLRDDNTIELIPEGRTGVAPVTRDE